MSKALELPNLKIERGHIREVLTAIASRTDDELDDSEDGNDWSDWVGDAHPQEMLGRDSVEFFDDLFILLRLHPEFFHDVVIIGHVVHAVEERHDTLFVGVAPVASAPLLIVGGLIDMYAVTPHGHRGTTTDYTVELIGRIGDALNALLTS